MALSRAIRISKMPKFGEHQKERVCKIETAHGNTVVTRFFIDPRNIGNSAVANVLRLLGTLSPGVITFHFLGQGLEIPTYAKAR
jgi:hypothetical protein